MSNWLSTPQILVNLDNLADILVKKQGSSWALVGYTPSGFGIILYTGTDNDCQTLLGRIVKITGAVQL